MHEDWSIRSFSWISSFFSSLRSWFRSAREITYRIGNWRWTRFKSVIDSLLPYSNQFRVTRRRISRLQRISAVVGVQCERWEMGNVVADHTTIYSTPSGVFPPSRISSPFSLGIYWNTSNDHLQTAKVVEESHPLIIMVIPSLLLLFLNNHLSVCLHQVHSLHFIDRRTSRELSISMTSPVISSIFVLSLHPHVIISFTAYFISR